MKKPVNRFAVVLWTLAGLLLIGDAIEYLLLPALTLATIGDASMRRTIFETNWLSVSASLTSAAMLTAFGYIIELIDQIRWNQKNAKE